MFNSYKNLAQQLLHHLDILPVTLLRIEVVIQGDNLLVVLYGFSSSPLVEELWAADLGLLTRL